MRVRIPFRPLLLATKRRGSRATAGRIAIFAARTHFGQHGIVVVVARFEPAPDIHAHAPAECGFRRQSFGPWRAPDALVIEVQWAAERWGIKVEERSSSDVYARHRADFG